MEARSRTGRSRIVRLYVTPKPSPIGQARWVFTHWADLSIALSYPIAVLFFICTSGATHNARKWATRAVICQLRKGVLRCTFSGKLKVIRANKFGRVALSNAIRGVSLNPGSRDESCPARAALRPVLAAAASSRQPRNCAMKLLYPRCCVVRCFGPMVAIAGSAPPAAPVARVSSRSPCLTSNSSFCAFLVFRVRAGFSWIPLLTWI